jgi:hypothetical protein
LLLRLVGLFGLMAASCGGGAANPDGAPRDADFTVCAKYDAGPYMAGYVTASDGGGYTVTLASVSAMPMDGPVMSSPAVGFDTFMVVVQDASGAAPAGITMTAEKPVMPQHNHGATTFPVVVDQGDGSFEVSAIHFFMPGYWELTLNLLPEADAGGAADKVVLSICVPS